MLRKIDKLLKQCKGKTTIKKFEDLLNRLTGLIKYDLDILMRGNEIPYRVTVAAGVSKEEWETTPDNGFEVFVRHHDPDLIGKLIFAQIIEKRKATDTTFTFLDYDSKTVKLRIEGDNYSDPVFIAYFRGIWNGQLDDTRREIEHTQKKKEETWRQSL